MAVLAPAERTLLRLHFVDGLSLDKLAVIEQISRSTVARRLVELRARLAAATKAELHRALGIAGKELDSMVGLLQSQLHLSLARLLG
jgi:RNA polymerase sigma-70 factor (ECF subfamily)